MHALIKELVIRWVEHRLEIHCNKSRHLTEATEIACLRRRFLYVLQQALPFCTRHHLCRQGVTLASTEQLRSQGLVSVHAHLRREEPCPRKRKERTINRTETGKMVGTGTGTGRGRDGNGGGDKRRKTRRGREREGNEGSSQGRNGDGNGNDIRGGGGGARESAKPRLKQSRR